MKVDCYCYMKATLYRREIYHIPDARKLVEFPILTSATLEICGAARATPRYGCTRPMWIGLIPQEVTIIACLYIHEHERGWKPGTNRVKPGYPERQETRMTRMSEYPESIDATVRVMVQSNSTVVLDPQIKSSTSYYIEKPPIFQFPWQLNRLIWLCKHTCHWRLGCRHICIWPGIQAPILTQA